MRQVRTKPRVLKKITQNLTAEESEVRIIWIGIFISIWLSIIVAIQIGYRLVSDKQPTIVVRPSIPKDAFFRHFPIVHFALILKDGTVIDVSSSPSKSPSRGKLLKLPYSSKYHGYTDDKGVLFFIDGVLKKPVVKFHPSLNKAGHQTLEMNGIWKENPMFVFKESVRIGRDLWIGRPACLTSYLNVYCPAKGESVIWNSHKKYLLKVSSQ